MRSVSALFVALVVVAAAPIGVAAASGVPAAATGLTAIQDDGVSAQTTATNTTNETSTTTAEPTDDGDTEAGNDSAEPASIAPGAQLAAVVGVQQTEIGSEVEARAFGQRIAAADSNASKAEVVADSLNDSRERLTELRDRLAELEAARESGNLSESRYRARVAQLSARINAVERRLEQANETATELPEPALEEQDVNVSTIERLRDRARNLSGPEVAAIAREIAGENPGRGMGGPPANAGPPAGAGEPDRGGDAPGRNAIGANATGERPGNGQGPPADGNESASGGASGAPGQSGNASGDSGNGSRGESPNEATDRDGSGADNSTRGGSNAAPGKSGDASGNNGYDASLRIDFPVPFDFFGRSDIRI